MFMYEYDMKSHIRRELLIHLFSLQDSSSLIKAQEEVDSVLQGRLPSYEDVKELKFLTRCIMESLRLYPHPPVGCKPPSSSLSKL